MTGDLSHLAGALILNKYAYPVAELLPSAFVWSIALIVVSAARAGGLPEAAQTDGVRQLTEQVYDTRLSDGRIVGELIRTSAVDLQLRQLIRDHASGSPLINQAINSTGVALAQQPSTAFVVKLSVDDIIAALGETSTDTQLRLILEPIAGRWFVALGIADRATTNPGHPSGWEIVTSGGKAMAVDIARDDALRQMNAALVKHVKPDVPKADVQQLRDAFRLSAASAKPVWHACQVCTITVPFEIDGIQYSAVGYGVPPWREVHLWSSDSALEAPPWGTQTLVATGKGATNANEIDERKLSVARSTAKADALIKIATKVDELPLPGGPGLTFGEWLKRSHKYDALWSAYLHTAHATQQDVAGGVFTIEMTLELDRLWRLILAVDHAENAASQLARPNVR
ncbi:MAG: hypothetical protein DHS20C16_03090 [Phycisphaerae bacterium]|nr:MAG: hypothetical protein DHS20C16_03090 [Phycisphaerae bacterium]